MSSTKRLRTAFVSLIVLALAITMMTTSAFATNEKIKGGAGQATDVAKAEQINQAEQISTTNEDAATASRTEVTAENTANQDVGALALNQNNRWAATIMQTAAPPIANNNEPSTINSSQSQVFDDSSGTTVNTTTARAAPNQVTALMLSVTDIQLRL